MRFFRTSTARVLLLIAFCGGLLGIFFNYRSRSDQLDPSPTEPELLSSDITRQSTGFEYSQLKEGRVLFQVFAETSTLNDSGEHLLEEVRLIRLGPDGETTDEVEGTLAAYSLTEKELVFRKNVVIRLSDGTEILADWARADLEQEQLRIREEFQFHQGEMQGRGKQLFYSLPKRRLEVSGGLQLELAGGERGRTFSRRAVYEIDGSWFHLSGGARIEGRGRSLRGDHIRGVLDETRAVRRLVAEGGAELSLEERRFFGQEIELGIPMKEEAGSLRVGSSGARGALYESTAQGHDVELRGREIRALYWEETEEGRGPSIGEMEVGGQVALLSRSLGIRHGEAEGLTAGFHPVHRFLSELVFQGRARLERVPAEGELEILEGRDLVLHLAAAARPVKVRIDGPATLQRERAGESWTATMETGFDVDYRDGLMHRTVSRGPGIMKSASTEERIELRGADFEILLQEGEPESVHVAREVVLRREKDQERLMTRSSSLEVEYLEGRLRSARQEGDFVLERTGPAGRVFLEADEARFDPAEGRVAARGVRRPLLRYLETEDGDQAFQVRAESLDLGEEGELRGKNEVEAVFDQGEGESLVLADSIEGNPRSGWLEFTGNPQWIQGENLIRGDRIRMNGGNRELEVVGGVSSYFVEQTGERRRFQIEGDEFRLGSDRSRAEYRGEVVLRSRDLKLHAPELDLVFASGQQRDLERVEARGGVVIVEGDRRWNAQSATYFREDDRVLVGPP